MSDVSSTQATAAPLMPPVRLELTRKDLARWDNHLQNHFQPRITWLVRYIPTGALLFLSILNFTIWDSPWFGVQGLLFTVGWFWALGWPIHWLMRWRWGARLQTQGLPTPTELVATPEGLHIGDDFRAWHELLRTARSRTHLYIFVDDARALIVPARCFPSRDAFEDFARLCDRRLADAGSYAEKRDEDPPPDAIRYTLNHDDLTKRNNEFIRKLGLRGPLLVRLLLVAVFLIISVAMWPWWQNLSAAFLGPGNLAVALWNLLPGPYLRRVSRWWATDSLGGELTRDVAIWYDDTGVWWWERGRRFLFRWNNVGLAEPYNHSAVVYVGPTMALPLPLRAFESEQSFEAFVDGIRQRSRGDLAA